MQFCRGMKGSKEKTSLIPPVPGSRRIPRIDSSGVELRADEH